MTHRLRCIVRKRLYHVDVRGLEAALVDVVVGEGLGRVGAVLIHGDGDLPLGGYSARHGTSGWGMSRSQRNRGDPVSKHPLVPRLESESPPSLLAQKRSEVVR